MRSNGVLVISTYLKETDAAYRRLSYFIKYFRSKGLKVPCAGFLRISRHGIIKPSNKCYKISILVSTAFFDLLINFILSLYVIVVIFIFRPRVILLSIPDSYPAFATYLGSLLTGSKLFIDIRDPQEEIMAHKYKKGFSGFVVRIYRQVNYNLYKRAHVITGVTKTLAITLSKKLGKVVYLVPNGADLRIFKPADKKLARARFGIDQDALVVGYVGFISSRGYYNILPILLAIRRVRRRLNANIKLAVAGPIYDDSVKRIIDYFIEELQYIGVLSTRDVVTFLSACDIGVIPRVDDPIYDYAVPTKFYEYVAIGLPLIVMANRGSELSRIVENNKLGFVCEPQDHVCLERAIITLVMNKSWLNEFRKNVLGFRKYVDRKIGAERLFRLIERLTFDNKNGI